MKQTSALITRMALILIMLPALTVAGDSAEDAFGWLAGCWETPDKTAREVWVVDSDRLLIGFGVAISGRKDGSEAALGFHEVMSISRLDDGSWAFRAYPSGQAPASFMAVELSDTRAVFANPKHDYPQQIRYQRVEDRLHATVSLIGGAKANSFEKVACQ